MKIKDSYVYHTAKQKFVPIIEWLEDSITDERLTTIQEPPTAVKLAMEKTK
ncbi:hypothetical protein C3B79_2628 [Aeromonas hydrophila]|uniref:hypothetical protein n=1 Tax=Aeromonas hydrophila TaxID=644 RepID=UPI000FD16C5D|nr:hypothetical protein [Aeromonas hydrophila]AZU48386.1 hypothetical protein C3B79_2628 [Aeromonas hydrophila]